MIKKLRMKLIAAAMVSLLAVLLVIEGAAGCLSYRKTVQDADRILAFLKKHEGQFPENMYPKKRGEELLRSPELPYESRYFSVLLDEEGNAVSADTGKIASVDTSAAVKYGEKVFQSGNEKGFIGDYRYLSDRSGEKTRIIFLDCGRNLSAFYNFVRTAAGASFAGLAAVFLLLVLLSARIVKPFSENYEKQKRFITDAGHELKTPLTIIDADAEVLEMDIGENEWLEDIRGQTKRLAELTNDLILLSRMEEEGEREQRIEFLLSDIVEETVGEFQALAKTQGKTLQRDIRPMISMTGDEKAIRRMVGILLDNAMKYSDAGGEISVTLRKQKNRIVLSVFNTAEHIAREDLRHLFDRFYRTDKSRNSKTGGYGLGLSIAAATVKAHKGKITASTEDEKSLRITITI